MKRFRLLGLMLMAVLTLGAVASSSASAVEEPGLLTLSELSELKVEQEKAESLANVVKLTGAGQTIECRRLWLLPGKLINGPRHWNLIVDRDWHLLECMQGANKCKSGNDVSGTMLLLLDTHWVSWLEGTTLVSGEIDSTLNEKLENLPTPITCGVVKFEVKGAIPFKSVQLSEEGKEVKEGETKKFTITAKPGLKCDTADESCKKLYEANPLLISAGKGFEAAEMTSEAEKLIASANVTWDF